MSHAHALFLTLAVMPALAAAAPLVPGATATLVGQLPPGFGARTMGEGGDPAGTAAGRWLYFTGDQGAATTAPLIRMSLATGSNGPAATLGAVQQYSVAVHHAAALAVDDGGTLLSPAGCVLVACTDPTSGQGELRAVNPAAHDGENGLASAALFAGPFASLAASDSVAIAANGRLYINAAGASRVMRLVRPALEDTETIEVFATQPAGGATLMTDINHQLWSLGDDGVARRTTNTGSLPRPAPLMVDLGAGLSGGLVRGERHGPWGSGMLAVTRGLDGGRLVQIAADGTTTTVGTNLGDVRAMCINGATLYTADSTDGLVWRIQRQVALPCSPVDMGNGAGMPYPDGYLNAGDFIVYIDRFFYGDPVADHGRTGGLPGPDGRLDMNDLVVFIDEFFAGC